MGYVLTAFDQQRESAGSQPATIRANANADAICDVTESEFAHAIGVAMRRLNGESVIGAAVDSSAAIFLRTLAVGRRLMHGTNEEGARYRNKIYAMRRRFGGRYVFTPVRARAHTHTHTHTLSHTN